MFIQISLLCFVLRGEANNTEALLLSLSCLVALISLTVWPLWFRWYQSSSYERSLNSVFSLILERQMNRERKSEFNLNRQPTTDPLAIPLGANFVIRTSKL